MPDPAPEMPRNGGAHRTTNRVFVAIALIAWLVGLALIVAERAPGLAWPLVVTGAALLSIPLAGMGQARRD